MLAGAHPGLEVLTAGGALGEDVVRASGLRPRVVYRARRAGRPPRRHGPRRRRLRRCGRRPGAVRRRRRHGAGAAQRRQGCGRCAPARTVALLGIPAGVKMYSGCFAVAPARGRRDRRGMEPTRGACRRGKPKVLDLDEDAPAGRVAPIPRLLRPRERTGRSAGDPGAQGADADQRRDAVRRAAAGVIARFQPGVRYLLGPGGTLAAVSRELGIPGTAARRRHGAGRAAASPATSPDDEALDAVAGRPARPSSRDRRPGLPARPRQPAALARCRSQPSVPTRCSSSPRSRNSSTCRDDRCWSTPAIPVSTHGWPGHVRVTTGPASSSIYPVSAASAATTEGAPSCV